jgi:hypothetical protein
MDENEKRESVVRRPEFKNNTNLSWPQEEEKSENFSWEHWNRVVIEKRYFFVRKVVC